MATLPFSMHRLFVLLLLVLTAWSPQALAACPMDAPADEGAPVTEHDEGTEHHGPHHGPHDEAPASAPDHHGSHGGQDAETCPVPGMCATSLLSPIRISTGEEPPGSLLPPTIPHDGAAAPTPPLDPPPPRPPV